MSGVMPMPSVSTPRRLQPHDNGRDLWYVESRNHSGHFVAASAGWNVTKPLRGKLFQA